MHPSWFAVLCRSRTPQYRLAAALLYAVLQPVLPARACLLFSLCVFHSVNSRLSVPIPVISKMRLACPASGSIVCAPT